MHVSVFVCPGAIRLSVDSEGLEKGSGIVVKCNLMIFKYFITIFTVCEITVLCEADFGDVYEDYTCFDMLAYFT